MRPIIEDQPLRKSNLEMLELFILVIRRRVGPSCRILPQRLLTTIRRTDDSSPGIDENAIPVRMIAMIVGIENILDRLVSSLANIIQDGPRTPGIIGVNRQHIVAKNNPPGIGDDPFIRLRSSIVDIGSKLMSLT